RNWIRDKDGHHLWIVAVKATFNVALNGQLSLADEQPPPALAPEYEGEPGASSLLFDSDLLYAKPCTDVIAVAQAHAPGGQPRETTMVSLRVGPIQKRLVVHGDRSFMPAIHGVAPGSTKPFVRRPIRYEWAFGGMDLQDPLPSKHRIDDRNPIGKGFAV